MDDIQNKMEHLALTKEQKNVFIDLQRAITTNQKTQFHKAMKKYKELLKEKFVEKNCTQLSLKSSHNKELFVDLFRISLKYPNKYYRDELYELSSKFYMSSKESTELLRIAIQENDVEIANKCVINGANLTEFDSLCTTPLEDAIRCNNLEIICMLLYYGGYTNNMENNLTSFMFSIICQCSEDIQRILMEYETDYNLCCDNDSTLFMALMYQSPLIFDLIERGADPNFTKSSYNGTVIAPLEAIRCKCDVEIVRKLWTIFDYNIWINHDTGRSSSSVLCKFLEFFLDEDDNLSEYLEVFLENEEKLKLEIEHHENVQHTSLVYDFYRICVQRELFDEQMTQNFVLHLLSYGAPIYKTDIDKLYYISSIKESTFFEELLFMDLHDVEDISKADVVTLMYFKYTLRPDIDYFLIKLLASYQNRNRRISITNVMEAISELRELFAFKYDIKKYYKEFFREHEDIVLSLEHVKCFPSLLQLSRDSSRKAVCDNYEIKNIGQFYTIINSLDISNVIKQLLIYKQKIYRIS